MPLELPEIGLRERSGVERQLPLPTLLIHLDKEGGLDKGLVDHPVAARLAEMEGQLAAAQEFRLFTYAAAGIAALGESHPVEPVAPRVAQRYLAAVPP